jgi:hypothetical protein
LGKDLYFIRCDDAVKIGVSSDPKRRFDILRSSNHRPLELLAVLPGWAWQEKLWHVAFGDSRVSGEWFRETKGLTAAIQAAVKGEEWIATLSSGVSEEADYEMRNVIADLEEELSRHTI